MLRLHGFPACMEPHNPSVMHLNNLSQCNPVGDSVEVMPILQLPNAPPAILNPLLLHGAFSTSGPNAPVPMAPAVSDNPNLIGYRAVSSVKVAVRNVNRAGEVIDILTRAGAVSTGSIRYLLQDEATLERTLLEEAVRRARDKATVLAAAVGKSAGNPISISEEVTAFQPQQFFGNGRHNPFLTPSASYCPAAVHQRPTHVLCKS